MKRLTLSLIILSSFFILFSETITNYIAQDCSYRTVSNYKNEQLKLTVPNYLKTNSKDFKTVFSNTNGLFDYSKRKDLYKDIILEIVLQEDFSEFNFFSLLRNSNLFTSEEMKQVVNFHIKSLEQNDSGKYNKLIKDSKTLGESSITSYRYAKLLKNKNVSFKFSSAYSSLSLGLDALSEIIELTNKSIKILDSYYLYTSFDYIAAKGRLDVISNQLSQLDRARISIDKALIAAINELSYDLSDISKNKLMAYRLALKNAGINVLNSSSKLLNLTVKGLGISGKISARLSALSAVPLFGLDLTKQYFERSDLIAKSVLTASLNRYIYNLDESGLDEKYNTENKEYIQYQFYKLNYDSFDNTVYHVWSLFTSKYKKNRESWGKIKDDIINYINNRRTNYIFSENDELDNNKINDNLVFVKGGTFQMGSNGSYANDDEQPVHTVTVGENAHSRVQSGFLYW